MARQIWASGPKCVSLCVFVCLSSRADTQTRHTISSSSSFLLVFSYLSVNQQCPFPRCLFPCRVLFQHFESFSSMTRVILKHFKNTPINALSEANTHTHKKNSEARRGMQRGQGQRRSQCAWCFFVSAWRRKKKAETSRFFWEIFNQGVFVAAGIVKVTPFKKMNTNLKQLKDEAIQERERTPQRHIHLQDQAQVSTFICPGGHFHSNY